MAFPANPKQKFLFDVPAAGSWSTPQRVTLMGQSGRIGRSVLRAPAGSAITEVDVLVYQGRYNVGHSPAAVPDEDRVYDETGITVAGHATNADLDRNLIELGTGFYDTTPSDESMWAAIKGVVGTAQVGVVLALIAIEAEP